MVRAGGAGRRRAGAPRRQLSVGRGVALLFCAAAALKALLGVGYRSTDFEVHRNWKVHARPFSTTLTRAWPLS